MNGSIPQYDNNSFKSVYNGHLISSLILLSLPTHNHTRFFFLLITFPDVLICVRDCASLSSALTVSTFSQFTAMQNKLSLSFGHLHHHHRENVQPLGMLSRHIVLCPRQFLNPKECTVNVYF